MSTLGLGHHVVLVGIAGNGIFLDHQFMAVGGGGADVWPGIELVPRPHLGGEHVFSFCFVDFGLSSAQYILDDPLATLLSYSAVFPLPAAILTFWMLPSPLARCFAMRSPPLKLHIISQETEKG